MTDPKRKVEAYLRAATRGLWGRERATVREELEAHVEARVAAQVLAGATEGEAVEQTLAELGPPRDVSGGMNRVYFPPHTMLSLRLALWQFRSRPLESALIVVAVALGVAVVTAVAAVLDLDRQARARYDALLASREITLQPVESDPNAFKLPGGVSVPARRLGAVGDQAPSMSPEHLQAALGVAPSVDFAYVAEVRDYHKQAWRQTDPEVVNPLFGLNVTADFISAARVEVDSGSLFAPSDFERGGVMLVTEEAAARLELPEPPLGARVHFDATPGLPEFTVIGILSAPVVTSTGGWEYHMVVPYSPDPFGALDKLTFAVASGRDLPGARAELEEFARSTWGDLVAVSVQPGRDHVERGQRAVGLVIAAFATAGLVVAALNIMNLMLARVVRRYRHIGVQRSLGAAGRQVRRQFLIEALVLGAVGGTVGVIGGFGLLTAYNLYLAEAIEGVSISVAFSPLAALAGFGLAVGVTLLFGLYPALSASRVRIVDALRGA